MIVSRTNTYPQDWTPDGRILVFSRSHAQTGEDIWLRNADGEEHVYLQTPFDEREAQVSPDGRFLAYASNETGRPEVYVRPFPAAAGQWRVSVDGGGEPRWRADGRELFYVSSDRRLMAVPIAAGPVFTPGLPMALSEVRLAQTSWWDYVVMPDGQEFVIKQAVAAASAPLTVVLDWRHQLRP